MVDWYDAPIDQQPSADFNDIGPGFLSTIGLPLLAGREFTRADSETSLPVAVVDETMTAQFWRGADPVGRRVQVKGQVAAGRRRLESREIREPARVTEAVLLHAAATATEFLGGLGAADPDAATCRARPGARAENSCAGRERLPRAS